MWLLLLNQYFIRTLCVRMLTSILLEVSWGSFYSLRGMLITLPLLFIASLTFDSHYVLLATLPRNVVDLVSVVDRHKLDSLQCIYILLYGVIYHLLCSCLLYESNNFEESVTRSLTIFIKLVYTWEIHRKFPATWQTEIRKPTASSKRRVDMSACNTFVCNSFGHVYAQL